MQALEEDSKSKIEEQIRKRKALEAKTVWMGPCENLDEKTQKLYLDLMHFQKEDAKLEECKMPEVDIQ